VVTKFPKFAGRAPGMLPLIGCVLKRLIRIHAILRFLHGDGVLHAFFGSSQKAGAVWKLELSETRRLSHVARLHAQDWHEPGRSHVQRGIVKSLLTCTSTAPGMCRNSLAIFPDQIISALVRTGDFHIDRRGSPEVQDLRHDIRGLKENCTPESVAELLAQFIEGTCRWLAADFLQLDEKFRVGTTNGAELL